MIKKILLFCLLPFSVNAQLNITFKSQLDYVGTGLHSTTGLSNLWGYTDETGKEYAIVGLSGGVSIVDVTDPTTPVEVFFQSGLNSIWREIKTYNNYAYITTEAHEGMMIIDLNPLPGTITSANVTHFTGPVSNPWISAHSLFIDENGILFLHGSNRGNGGAILYDLNTSPTNPTEIGSYDTWYVHDSYARGDTLYAAHINDGFFTVTNVSTPSSITMLSGEQHTPKNFTHNCWLSQNGDYLFTTDEVSGAWIAAYDITDLSDIKEVDRIRRSETSGSIPHNTYWLNNYLVTSYYRDGVTIHDVTDPSNMIEVGNYDTSPMSGDGFNGAWGVYAFLPSGNLLISDIEKGLFVLAPTYTRACYLAGQVTDASTTLSLNNVQVDVLTTANFDNTDFTGLYSTGVATAGTYSVVYSKAGYVSDTVSVNLVSATTVTQDVALVPLPIFTLNGTVTFISSGAPVNGAQVSISNNEYTYLATTNAAGAYSIPGFVLDPGHDTFEVIAGAWGTTINCQPSLVIDSTSNPLNFLVDHEIYDDFSLDYGWTVNSTAISGIWVRDVPFGATNGSILSNPDSDDASDCSNKAFVTGNANNATASADDVDNGYTLLTSPVFSTTGIADPWIGLDVWFSNSGGSGAPNDTLIVSLNDGTSTHVMAKYTIHNIPISSWTHESYKLSSFTSATTNLKFMVQVTDYNPGHVVDGAIDAFRVVDGNPFLGIDEPVSVAANGLQVYPNPTNAQITVTSEISIKSIQVIDITGKIVFNKNVNDKTCMLDLSVLEHGIYSIRTVDVNGKAASARIVKQ